MKTRPFFHPSQRAALRGFTLMEMLIVLTIIALLMGMVIFQVKDFSGNAKGTKADADIMAFKEMIAAYQLGSGGTLPTTEQGLKVLWTRPTTEPIPRNWHALLTTETMDPWGHHYVYRAPGKHDNDYDVFSMGPDGQADTDDDIGNWQAGPAKP